MWHVLKTPPYHYLPPSTRTFIFINFTQPFWHRHKIFIEVKQKKSLTAGGTKWLAKSFFVFRACFERFTSPKKPKGNERESENETHDFKLLIWSESMELKLKLWSNMKINFEEFCGFVEKCFPSKTFELTLKFSIYSKNLILLRLLIISLSITLFLPIYLPQIFKTARNLRLM